MITETLGVGFTGTSITEASPTGFRPLTQDHLQSTYTNIRFFFPGVYWGGGKTWETLWQLQSGIVDKQPKVIVNDLIGTNNTTQGRAEIEALIRRLRASLPNARIVLLVMPSFPTIGDPTNAIATLNADTRTLATHYGCTVVDWTAEFYDLLDAETYTQVDLYTDIVHPTVLGHSVISDFLNETLTLDFIHGSDGWSGNLAGYSRLYDDGTFEDTANYSAQNGTAGTRTGTWTTVAGTQVSSSEADATIEFTFTGVSWGFHMGTYNVSVSIGITVDGGVENVVALAPNRPYIRMGADMIDTSHTVHIRVVSGTFHLARFLAI